MSRDSKDESLADIVLQPQRLEQIKQLLVKQDDRLLELFRVVPTIDFASVTKPAYVALVGAIIGQRISLPRARVIRSRLYTTLDGSRFTQSQVDALTDDALREIGFNDVQLATLRAANRFLTERKLPLETAQEIRLLSHVPGIKDWTVNNVLLVTLKDADVFAHNDIFIAKRLQQLYKLAKRPTAAQVAHMSEKWRPVRSVVCWYFWRWE